MACLVALVFAFFLVATLGLGPALAIETIDVDKDSPAIDLSAIGEWHYDIDGNLRISTAPDREGIVRRVEIRPKDETGNSSWYVFALSNNSGEQIDRLIVSPHYRLVRSGFFWPDLDNSRIINITPSEGFALERQNEREADVFLITLDPGAVITLIAEIKTKQLPQLVLWEPSAYKDAVNSLTLYRGIVLGIAGLLAVFLTILVVIKIAMVYPAIAALAWAVLAYVCVDFGFWDRVVAFTNIAKPFWRAGAEVMLAFTILIFIYIYLRLSGWHRNLFFVFVSWLLGLGVLFGLLLFDAQMASGLARLSFGMTIVLVIPLIVYLSFRSDDRAIMLVPSWLLLIAWLFAAWMTATGRLSNDIIQPALGGGLVLIIMLLGFTIMQNAFSGGALAQGLISDAELSALAVAGSGDMLFDWDVGRNHLRPMPMLGEVLSLPMRDLSGPIKNVQNRLHPNDRDRFYAALESAVKYKRGKISQSFRMLDQNDHYRWFELRARPMVGTDDKVIRCIGTLTEVTDRKNAEERLLQDSVRDCFTGLENRELFVNRLDMVIQLALRDQAPRPSVFHINIDDFKQINKQIGFAAGDTILLTVARRLETLLKPGDAIARLAGDQFAILLISEKDPGKIAGFAGIIRKLLKAPVQFAEHEITLTASIGIASWTKEQSDPDSLMRDAELAMMHAKSLGGNRIEPFRPAFRSGRDSNVLMRQDLARAMEHQQIAVFYQPIVSLEDQVTVGFEALVRWEHPKLGLVSPADFIPLAETAGLINQLGIYVLEQSVADFTEIHKKYPDYAPFVSVNISSRELLREDFVADIQNALKKTGFDPEHLKIEITESLVMENPEHSNQVLARLKKLGVSLALDDFGTGYSSLAYLLRFPFDTIKIDSSFIQARKRRERLVVLKSIITMAHGLNQSLIAEGVELDSDVAELKELNCEYAQGYLFGEAIDISQVDAMLSQQLKLAGQ